MGKIVHANFHSQPTKLAMRSLLINVVMLALVGAATVEHKTQLALNPIRKVVNLLQAMQKKVEEEGETEAKLYEKFMCYCKNGAGDLEASISAAEDKLASLPNEIKAAVEKLSQLKADVKQHQTDKQAAKDAMAEATAIREKEAAAFAKEKSYFDSTITAITKAVAALEKGVAGGFLQTSAAATLKTVVQTADMEEADRTMLTSFLSGQVGYAPQSGQIIGILKQMGDTMAADLATATATEEAAIKTYDELMASKKEEVDALTASIEQKLKEIGEVGIEVVEMKEDVDDTEKALAADKKFLAELEKGCATKTKEWEERSKTRAEELVALADTIKVLNDDVALDLFKKNTSKCKCQLHADDCDFKIFADASPGRNPQSKIRRWSRSPSRTGFLSLGTLGKDGNERTKL